MAVQAYGHVRTTFDLDVIAAWTPENLRRLAAALDELGARLRGVDADLLEVDLTDPRQLYDGGNFLIAPATETSTSSRSTRPRAPPAPMNNCAGEPSPSTSSARGS